MYLRSITRSEFAKTGPPGESAGRRLMGLGRPCTGAKPPTHKMRGDLSKSTRPFSSYLEINPDHLLAQDGDGTTPGTSGSGRSMAGSEQHIEYTPYLRGVWSQRWK
jgi:hypothetical protein